MKLGIFRRFKGFLGMDSKETKGIFFGWYTVIVSALMGLWSAGTWYYGFGAYFKPLAQEFNLSRATTSSLWSIGRFEGGVEGPFGGIATDRWGPRAIHLIGVFLSGLGFCLMYFATNLLTIALFWVITSIGFNLGYAGPLDKALTDWFVRKRGTVLTISRLGRVAGGSVMPSFMTFFLIHYGWRSAFLIVGILTWIIGLPTALFLVKRYRPEYYGLMPDGMKVEGEAMDMEALIKAGQEYTSKLGEHEFSTREALKTKAYWIPQIADSFSGWIYPAVTVHIIPFLTDIGISPVIAAATMGFMVFMSTPGRIIGGVVSDRLSTKNIKYLLMGSSLSYAVGMLILITLVSTTKIVWFIYACLAFFGVGIGIFTTAQPMLYARFFGRKNFGTITGVYAMIRLSISLASPVYAGWIYDITGNYMSAFTTTLGLCVVGIVLYFLTQPPKLPMHGTPGVQ
jgi:sugar phosphate permease